MLPIDCHLAPSRCVLFYSSDHAAYRASDSEADASLSAWTG